MENRKWFSISCYESMSIKSFTFFWLRLSKIFYVSICCCFIKLVDYFWKSNLILSVNSTLDFQNCEGVNPVYCTTWRIDWNLNNPFQLYFTRLYLVTWQPLSPDCTPPRLATTHRWRRCASLSDFIRFPTLCDTELKITPITCGRTRTVLTWTR